MVSSCAQFRASSPPSVRKSRNQAKPCSDVASQRRLPAVQSRINCAPAAGSPGHGSGGVTDKRFGMICDVTASRLDAQTCVKRARQPGQAAGGVVLIRGGSSGILQTQDIVGVSAVGEGRRACDQDVGTSVDDLGGVVKIYAAIDLQINCSAWHIFA